MQEVAKAVATVLFEMKEYTRPGMNTLEIDEYGGKLLKKMGAQSAPKLVYNFPGHTCISVNHEIAHGIPRVNSIVRDGDLINIDVSAELNGFFADNGMSFVMGQDLYGHAHLVATSKIILKKAIEQIKDGVRISAIGRTIEAEAFKAGYKVIKNLCGHGIGRKLHEEPREITNYPDKFNFKKFTKNSVVAIETFISTKSNMAYTMKDGWTLSGNKGGYVAQHEHTLVVTEDAPVILTTGNGIWS